VTPMSTRTKVKSVRALESQGKLTRSFAFLSLLTALMFVLVACGGGDPTATSAPASAAPSAAGSARPSGAASAAPSAAASAAPSAAASAAPSTAPSGGAATRTTAASTPPSTATRTATAAGTATRTGSPTAGAGATPNTSIVINGPFPGEANTLTGTGATFPQVLYSRWFEEYAKVTNVRVNYQGTGSSAGKNAIRDQTADFAGSDSPMSDAELEAARAKCGDTIMHIPTTLGAIVVSYNIPNLSQPLKMDGDVIAGIFLEQIKKWNDPKIAALNPGVNLPNQDIITVHRSDGSGTTQNFTNYLTAVSPAWAAGPKSGTTVNWPGGIGASGNPGVANEIKNTPYAVGYIELAFAKQNNLPFADVRNQAGNFVRANAASVSAAGQAQAGSLPADLRAFITNAPGAESYPITAITWILVCPKQTDQAKATALTRMLWWATHSGQQFNEQLDYAPIPPSIIVRAEQMINNITVNGQRAFPGR
jgi:phosphate transport system substrate-binding protein